MRPAFLLATALVLATPLLSPAAHASPALLLSAEVDPGASHIPAGSCPILLRLRNTTRLAVSMIGRIEGEVGDEGFPSFRAFKFDNVRPGGMATEAINFDGNCSQVPAPGNGNGQLVVRGLLMCHEGLSNYLDCHNDIGTEISSARLPVAVKVEITDWDPGGTGASLPPGAGLAPMPAR